MRPAIPSNQLFAGAAETCITPRLPVPLAGYHSVRTARRVRDPLHCRAVAIQSGREIMVWIALDLILVPDGLTEAIRRQLSRRLKRSHVTCLVAATHTHSAPPPTNLLSDVASPAFLRQARRQALAAAWRALQRLQPARIGIGSGREATTVHNRRFIMRDGTIQTNPGVRNPEIVRAAGPVDPEVGVLKITDRQNRPLAAIVNFANHVDTLGLNEVSADWPGVMAAVLKRSLGHRLVPIYLIGAQGDINHVNVKSRRPVMGPSMMRKVGVAVAAAALKAWRRIPTHRQVTLRAVSQTVRFPIKRITPAQVAWARRVLRGVRLPFRVYQTLTSFELVKGGTAVDRLNAQEILAVARLPRRETARIQVLAVNGAAFVAIPGEVFAEIGLAIKRRSPFRRTWIVGLANDYLGYMPTDAGLRSGGYESMVARSSRLGAGTERRLISHSLDLLKQLAK